MTDTADVILARAVGLDEKEVRRMLDPRHSSKLPRIARVLRALGKELQLTVVESPKAPGRMSGRSRDQGLGARQKRKPCG
jgi:hypothetical protein